MTQEALKLALEALEAATRYGAGGFEDAKDAIKEALAQPEQKPVVCCQQYDTCLQPCTPRGVHLAQRTWVGLTDEEMEATFIECGGKWNGDFWKIEDADFHPFLRTIEAKLKERNT